MRTRWQREDSQSVRGCLEVDPWRATFSRGFDPLHDYDKSWSAPHAEWLGSDARRFALELLGDAVLAEADAVIANPRASPELEQLRLADAALADAWRKVPVVAPPSAKPETLLVKYGLPFELGGVSFEWGPPEHARDTSAHVAVFPARRVRLPGLKSIAAYRDGFVLTIEGREPQLLDREGARVDVVEQWLTLGFKTPGFSAVFASTVAVMDDAPWVQLHCHVHPLGEAFRVLGGDWWIQLRAGDGVVARTAGEPTPESPASA